MPAPCEMVRRLLVLGVDSRGARARGGGRLRLPAVQGSRAKLDLELRQRASAPRGHSRVIVRLNPGVPADAADTLVREPPRHARAPPCLGGGQVASVPDTALAALARLPGVQRRQPRPARARARWSAPARRSARPGSRMRSASTAPASASRSSTRASPTGTTTSGPAASRGSSTS